MAVDPSILAPFLSTNPKYRNMNGFGGAALQRARAGGLSDNQIRAALSGAGLTIGQDVGQALGADTSLYGFRGGSGQFGASSLAAAQAAGLTNHQIRTSLATSGLQIGDQAAQALNVNPGKTYIGISPHTIAKGFGDGFMGNAGGKYPLRPQLAPRGYAMDGRYSSDEGFSPTFYIAGGANDYEAHNHLFGLNYQGGPDIGGGYSDPDFHRINYIPPASDPFRPFGGYGAGGTMGGMNPAMSAFNAVMNRYGMAGNTGNNVTTPGPQPSFGSAGTTRNTATGVRTAGTPGGETVYNTMNRTGNPGLAIGGLNV